MKTKIEYTKLGNRNVLILRRSNPKATTLECPFCGSNHIHGTLGGHRSAHCATKAIKNEFVVSEDGTKLFQKDGYVLVNNL